MIVKITKLRNFGIFRNFSWRSDIPNFKRFNLIFGWNKSGKTTLSRSLSSCEKKSIQFEEYPKNGEFIIETENGINIVHSDCQNCTVQIKVFNKDFIKENVSFDPSNPSNPIVYVSEEDIESNKKLMGFKKNVLLLSQKYETAQKDRQKSEKYEDDFRKTTARTIKDIVGNLKVNDKYRDYDKASVKAKIESVGIDNFQKLSDNDFEKYKKLINGDVNQSQNIFAKYEINILVKGRNISSFISIYDGIKDLIEKKIISETIKRLENDSDLNAWVQQGFELHKKKSEEQKCLFCQNTLDRNILTSLSKHFSNDYENLQKDITDLMGKLDVLKKEKYIEKNSELYSDLQNDYRNEVKKLNEIIDKLNSWILEAADKLGKKNNNPMLIIKAPKAPEDFMLDYNTTIDNINAVIAKHNGKVANRDQELKMAKESLESHLIAIAVNEQDYKNIKEDFEENIIIEKDTKNALKRIIRILLNLKKKHPI